MTDLTDSILAAVTLRHSGAAIVREVCAPGVDCTRRIDALMFRNCKRTAIEVKTSRADFRRESDAKRDPWMRACHRFVYVAPTGVIPLDEVPERCGLWETDGWQIRVVKRAVVNHDPEPLHETVVQALAYRAMRLERAA